MQFDLTSFKKAAKRYAVRHSVPLNEAQQAFSELLGFKTTHDALKRLDATESEVATLSTSPPLFWCDLTFAEFNALCEGFLFHYRDRLATPSYDVGQGLMRLVLALHKESIKAKVTTFEFIQCFELEYLENRYALLNEDPSLWTSAELKLHRHLTLLRGFDSRKIGKKGGQGDEVKEEHLQAKATMYRIFDMLETVERSLEDGKRIMNSEHTVKNFLTRALHEKEHPKDYIKDIVRNIEIAAMHM